LRIEKSWAVFDKYYLKTEDSPYYAAAIILHPYGASVHQINWEKKWIRAATIAVEEPLESFKLESTIPARPQSTRSEL